MVVQADHGPHSDSRQSAFDSGDSHMRTSNSAPQDAPPNLAAWVMRRDRLCLPAAHTLHAVHGDNTQSTGHGVALHVTFCSVDPHALGDTPVGTLLTARLRVVYPPPQVAEHADQGDHAANWHGDSPSPHGVTSTKLGHPRPALVDGVNTDRHRSQ